MKLLMENWRNFLNEEEETLEKLNDLLFGDDNHPGGRPYNKAAEAMSDDSEPLEEQEGASQEYEEIIQDFLSVNKNISEVGSRTETIKDITTKAKAISRKASREMDEFQEQKIKDQNVDSLIETGNDFLVGLGELEAMIQNSIDEYKNLVNNEKFQNYMKARNAISLFTGESVETVRDPSKFDPSKSSGKSRRIKLLADFEREMQSSSVAVFTISRMLDMLYVLNKNMPEGPTKEKIQTLYDTLEAKASRFDEMPRQFIKFRDEKLRTKTAKENYEFASGFLKYVAQRKPPLFLPEGQEIYRGIALTLNAFNALERAIKTMPDVQFAGKDIASWTTDEGVASNFAYGGSGDATMAVILKAKATKGMYVEDFSRFSEEYEVICGGSAKVIGAKEDDEGILVLEVEFI